jgi:hypothetical protein
MEVKLFLLVHPKVIPVCNETFSGDQKCEKKNSVVLVRKRTIPTKRPQPADEGSAKFS